MPAGRIDRTTAGALLVVLLLTTAAPRPAAEVIEPPDRFVVESFDGAPPQASILWLTPAIQQDVQRILGHPLAALRLRYWQNAGRTVWVLDEIGKERPITTGFVIDEHVMRRVKVLVYRESRGGEVRYDFFTDQFQGARRTGRDDLGRPVDGISGATLSVGAVTRMAELALYLDGTVAGHDP